MARGMRRAVRFVVMAFVCVAAVAVHAFPAIPKESAKALGVTKGKPIETGIVFVNGKYLPPPYTVSRWGTGLRINNRKVSGQVIDWSEFVRTQAGAKAVRTTAPASDSPLELAPEPDGAETDGASLDDLFDDGAKVKKGGRKSKAKPRETVSYSFDGAFTPNEKSKALLTRLNASRSEVDRMLRLGGFLCFGDGYARISGDERTAEKLIAAVPELMQKSASAAELHAGVRSAGFEFLTEAFCEDLFRNRIDYRALQERREEMKKDKAWRKALNGSGTSSF